MTEESANYGKYARVERERRYLLRDLPPPLTRASPHLQITDNYINNTRLRLRHVRVPSTKERIWKLTQKFAPEKLSNTIITNIYLSEVEYQVLAVFEGNEIRKNRYSYEHAGRRFSIDLFLGRLWGLVLAETAFDTDDEMNCFEKPSFAVFDVTDDELFTGGKLVELSSENIKDELQRRAS